MIMAVLDTTALHLVVMQQITMAYNRHASLRRQHDIFSYKVRVGYSVLLKNGRGRLT
jgi:hypothetical protein